MFSAGFLLSYLNRAEAINDLRNVILVLSKQMRIKEDLTSLAILRDWLGDDRNGDWDRDWRMVSDGRVVGAAP